MGYRDLVIADGAVAYWRLGETSGTTAVDSVGGNNGTINAGVTLNQQGAIADGNPAMAFDGTTGYIQVADTPALSSPTTAITLEAWVKPTSFLLTYLTIATKGVAGTRFEYGFQVHNTGRIVYMWNGGSPATNATGLIPLNVWSHVVVVADETATPTIKAYLNGVFVSGSGWTPALPSGDFIISGPEPLSIGRRNTTTTPDQYFTGLIDEVAIYPTALTSAQIAAHYAAAATLTPAVQPSSPSGLEYLLGQPGGGVNAGVGTWVPVLNEWQLLIITTTGLGAIVSGTLVLEETDDPNDQSNATPRQLASINCALLTGGTKLCTHLGPASYGYVRANLGPNGVGGGGSIYVSMAGV